MKKKKRVVAKKASARRSSVKSTRTAKKSGFNIRYLSFAVVGLMLFGLVVVVPQKASVTKSVAGVSIANPLFAKADIAWSAVPGATGYNVYYKKAGQNLFTSAVRGLSKDTTTLTISHLAKNVSYEYQVTALNDRGEEFWFSPVTSIENLTSM